MHQVLVTVVLDPSTRVDDDARGIGCNQYRINKDNTKPKLGEYNKTFYVSYKLLPVLPKNNKG